jgi:uncharacterized protein (UPF0297 family)
MSRIFFIKTRKSISAKNYNYINNIQAFHASEDPVSAPRAMSQNSEPTKISKVKLDVRRPCTDNGHE